jgi:regulatory protein
LSTHKTYTEEEALKRMERYCAYQERCHKEVRQKLFEMRLNPESCDQIISDLIQSNFLNESRFAMAFARGKFRAKKWGKRRIVNELKFREISHYNVQLALKEIPDSEYSERKENLETISFIGGGKTN